MGGGGGGVAPRVRVCRGSGAILPQKILKSKCRPRKKWVSDAYSNVANVCSIYEWISG